MSQSTSWMLASAAMLTALSLVFLSLAIVAWHRMRSKRYNIEVPLSDLGDVSRLVRKAYLGSNHLAHQDERWKTSSSSANGIIPPSFGTAASNRL